MFKHIQHKPILKINQYMLFNASEYCSPILGITPARFLLLQSNWIYNSPCIHYMDMRRERDKTKRKTEKLTSSTQSRFSTLFWGRGIFLTLTLCLLVMPKKVSREGNWKPFFMSTAVTYNKRFIYILGYHLANSHRFWVKPVFPRFAALNI